MAKYEGQDHYLDPETGVFRDRLGIIDEMDMPNAKFSDGWSVAGFCAVE